MKTFDVYYNFTHIKVPYDVFGWALWIATNKDGTVTLHEELPYKMLDGWVSNKHSYNIPDKKIKRTAGWKNSREILDTDCCAFCRPTHQQKLIILYKELVTAIMPAYSNDKTWAEPLKIIHSVLTSHLSDIKALDDNENPLFGFHMSLDENGTRYLNHALRPYTEQQNQITLIIEPDDNMVYLDFINGEEYVSFSFSWLDDDDDEILSFDEYYTNTVCYKLNSFNETVETTLDDEPQEGIHCWAFNMMRCLYQMEKLYNV